MASTIDTSGIDATKPESVSATTASVRDNFSAIVTQLGNAKTDIEALQDGKQDVDADLTAIAALAKTDGNIIVGDGTNWVAESGATARTSLGLGTGDSPTFTTVDLTGITDGNIPYIGASGAANSPLSTDGTNVALGGTLGEWHSSARVTQIGTRTFVVQYVNNTYLLNNARINAAGSFVYETSDEAAALTLNANGSFDYRYAAAGTAGNPITFGTAIAFTTAGLIDSDTTYANTTASAANMFIGSNGEMARSTSSLRFKTDIEPMDEAVAYRVVREMDKIWYRSKCDADPQSWSYYGSSAEGMAEIDPRFVHWAWHYTTDPETGEKVRDDSKPPFPDGLAYERLTVPLALVLDKEIAKHEALTALLISKGVITQAEADAL